MTRKCRECHAKFVPVRPMQPTCQSFECQVAYANRAASKSAEKREKDERREHRAKKERIKTRSDWIKDAQKSFNAYIRERDAGKPCICCGQILESGNVGGSFDCGHYRSVGSAPHLRFDERNAHGQRKQCNRYGAGRAVDYRIGLISRLGLEVVESLESDNEPKRYTIDDLKTIRDTYRAKLKELKNGIE